MADFKVTKVSEPQPPYIPEQSQVTYYEFTTYKKAVAKDGSTVEVVHRKQRETLEALEAQLASIQEKVDAVKAL